MKTEWYITWKEDKTEPVVYWMTFDFTKTLHTNVSYEVIVKAKS